MSRLLIDTNILVYGIDEDSQFFRQSRKVLDQSESELVTTSKNLVEFLTVATRSTGYNLEADTALEIAEELIQNIVVIYPSQESLAILLELTERYHPSGLKIHDFEIISIGLASGIYEIATFNIKDYKEISLLEF